MAREFKETAHLKTNKANFDAGYDHIFNKDKAMTTIIENHQEMTEFGPMTTHRTVKYIHSSEDERIEKLEAQLKEANEVIGFYGDKNGEHWAACRDEDTAETCCHMIAEVSGGKRAREYLDKHKTPE